VPELGQAAMLRLLARGLALALACVALPVLAAGCSGSGGSGDSAVVRVGDHPIGKATVDHWSSVIRREGAFSSYRGEPAGTPEQRALALLISSQWLIDEARHEGVPVSEDAVSRLLAVRERENGELREQIRRTGQTIADVKLELRSELAAEALRKKLARRAASIAPREVGAFYRANPLLFETGVRITSMVEGQPSAAAAAAAAPRLGSARRFRGQATHTHVSWAPMIVRSPEMTRAVEAIFKARPGVVGAPVLMHRGWVIYVVRKIIPGKIKPLAQVRAEVLQRLDERHQLEIASSFDRYYTARWKSLTSCRAGYVGPGCPQYGQPLGVYEDPFSAGQHLLLSEPLNLS
jgi:hypothetical protein